MDRRWSGKPTGFDHQLVAVMLDRPTGEVSGDANELESGVFQEAGNISGIQVGKLQLKVIRPQQCSLRSKLFVPE